MFELVGQALEPAALQARLAAPEDGALVVFEGRVRNHHLGRPVTHLEYESFDEMARVEGDAIVEEAEKVFPGTHVLCVHRTGTVRIGEAAVWIGVTSAHRQAAFAACRHVIEEIKRRLPVWKKEHHPDGAAEWVNCVAEVRSAPDAEYHARQIALSEVGIAGQEKLAAARVLVVGVGGLGCPASLYLVGAGIGRLTVVDGGRVELSNLHRQILFTSAEVGAPKALAAASRLRPHNPAVEVVARDGELTAANARSLVAGQSVVLDCSDNFATRFVLHDACQALGVPLVQAAVHRFEGTLDVFVRGQGGCLHCLWPGRGAAELSGENCNGAPVFGPAVGVLGVMQAAEAVKLLLGQIGNSVRQTRLVDLRDGTSVMVERLPRKDCPVCQQSGQRSASTVGAGAAASEAPLFVEQARLSALGAHARVVFFAEPGESSPAYSTFPVPFSSAQDLAQVRELAATGPVVLTCRHGVLSAALARLLRSEGLANVYALANEVAGDRSAGLAG